MPGPQPCISFLRDIGLGSPRAQDAHTSRFHVFELSPRQPLLRRLDSTYDQKSSAHVHLGARLIAFYSHQHICRPTTSGWTGSIRPLDPATVVPLAFCKFAHNHHAIRKCTFDASGHFVSNRYRPKICSLSPAVLTNMTTKCYPFSKSVTSPLASTGLTPMPMPMLKSRSRRSGHNIQQHYGSVAFRIIDPAMD